MKDTSSKMDEQIRQKQFEWDALAAARKLGGGMRGSIRVGKHIEIGGQMAPHNPETDGYRVCRNCGKHINFHRDGECQ